MELVEAALKYFENFYYIKSEDNNIYWAGWNSKPNYESLKNFYTKVIENSNGNRKIFLGIENDKVIGYVYIDYINENTFHLSPAISEKYQGKGYGKKIIELGLNEGLKLGFKNMEAYIREDNIASQKCFEANGARKTDVYRMKYIENLNKELKMIKYYYESK